MANNFSEYHYTTQKNTANPVIFSSKLGQQALGAAASMGPTQFEESLLYCTPLPWVGLATPTR
jgi:hypothetical protein